MSLYQILRVANGADIFDALPKKDVKIPNSRFSTFSIRNHFDHISGNAIDVVKSIRSTEEREILEEIKIDFIIRKYKVFYCAVGLSGPGLMTIHAYPKYIRENVLNPLKNFLKNNYKINIDFESFEYSNEHFSKTFWGENIRSKLAYNSSEKMYMRISSPNCNEIIENNPILKSYFSNGIVRFVTANVPDLGYQKNDVKQIGTVKFQRNGIFHCLFFDIVFFNEFTEKLIDHGFFGEVK